MDGIEMQEHIAFQMSSYPYRCYFLQWKCCPKPFPQAQTQTHTKRRAAPGGPTWCVLQPIYRQRPDDFYPQGIHGNQEHGLLLVAWGMWVCFSHKHAELAARIQDACQEKRKTPSSDARAIRFPYTRSPGPGKLKPVKREGPLRLHMIR